MDSSQTPLKSRLESLECHFTWNLSRNISVLHRQQENLDDIRQHGCAWEGHLYNLLGYVVYHINTSTDEALTYLREAEAIITEAEGRGPQLLVNQANLAWMHYLLGELPESEPYLEKVAQLQKDFPAPPGCDLHPEVYGEKGWTQMKFDYDVKKESIANFEMALRGDPSRKKWHVGLALAKYEVHFDTEELRQEIIEQIHTAKTLDPDNLRMSVLYLSALADVGRKTKETVKEVHDLIKELKPDLDGLGDILDFLRKHDSLHSALRVAEEVVKNHPSERGAKLQLALCYKWKIFENRGTYNLDLNVVRKGIAIYEEVTRLYPHYLRGRIDLAGIYAKSQNIMRADQIFRDLLSKSEDLEPGALQLLYNRYGSHLKFFKRSVSESIDYHKKAAEIPKQSRARKNSIKFLRSMYWHPRWDEIRDFLSQTELNLN